MKKLPVKIRAASGRDWLRESGIMDWIRTLPDNSTAPALAANLLGLLTAISPCTRATDIAARGYMGKAVKTNKHG